MGKHRPRRHGYPLRLHESAATLTEASVSDAPWSSVSQADYTPEQWRRACLVDTGQGDEGSKDRYKLPVRMPDGTLNRNGVHAAAGGHGIGAVKGISADMKKSVARKLVGLYRGQLDEEPPDSLMSMAGMSAKESARPATAAGTVRLVEATTGMTRQGGRRYRARLIEGDRWGVSSYYPRRVLERDGPRAYPAGTLMYLDHPTPTEEAERPARSVRDLAARIATTPTYQGDGLYADVEVFPHVAPTIEALADTIGLSIRGEGMAEQGTVGGRTGPVLTELTHGYSVDFVTQAGAGGQLVALLEAARTRPLSEARNIGVWLESRLHLTLTQLADDMYGAGRLSREERITLSTAIGDGLAAWTARVEQDAPQLFQRDLYADPEAMATAEARRLAEATTEETRRALEAALRDAYPPPAGEDGMAMPMYVWVRDYDADRGLVWFEQNGPDGCTTWQQAYEIGDGGQVSLTGQRVQVVSRVVYEPVPAAGETTVTESAPTGEPTGIRESADPTGDPTPDPAPDEPAGGTDPADPPDQPGNGETTTTEADVADEPGVDPTTTPGTARPLYEAQLTQMRRELAAVQARESARGVLARTLADRWIPPATVARITESLMGRLPIDNGVLDEAQLVRLAEQAVVQAEQEMAEALQAAGLGRPRDLGQAGDPYAVGHVGVSTEQLDRRLEESFRALGNDERVAKVAARGRG